MTTGEIVELILLRVNGGQLSPDSAVQREEIRVYLPAAVSAIIESKMDAKRLAAKRMGTPFSPPDDLYSAITVKGRMDETIKQVVLDLPKLIELNGNIQMVKQVGGAVFIKTTAVNMCEIRTGAFFYIQKASDGSNLIVLNTKLNYKCDFTVMAAFMPDFQNENSAFPYSTIERDLIEISVAHFKDQRATPGDQQIDTKDLNEPNNA
jgi:hypothetical protein